MKNEKKEVFFLNGSFECMSTYCPLLALTRENGQEKRMFEQSDRLRKQSKVAESGLLTSIGWNSWL